MRIQTTSSRGMLFLTAGALGGCIFYVDQWTKRIFFAAPPAHALLPAPFSTWLQTTQHQNFGISFDLPVPAFMVIAITILILLCVVLALFRALRAAAWQPVLALACIIAGALGNLFDRLAFGYVRDWILVFERSAFNLADLAILIGLIWWLHVRRILAK